MVSLSKFQGLVRPEGKQIKFNYHIGSRTSDLPACSIMPQLLRYYLRAFRLDLFRFWEPGRVLPNEYGIELLVRWLGWGGGGEEIACSEHLLNWMITSWPTRGTGSADLNLGSLQPSIRDNIPNICWPRQTDQCRTNCTQ
jgi:hypothetical protein